MFDEIVCFLSKHATSKCIFTYVVCDKQVQGFLQKPVSLIVGFLSQNGERKKKKKKSESAPFHNKNILTFGKKCPTFSRKSKFSYFRGSFLEENAEHLSESWNFPILDRIKIITLIKLLFYC